MNNSVTEEKQKKGIVFFDLDGTLLDDWKDEIPGSALRAIEKLRENYYIVISTGRDMDTHYSYKYKEIINPDAIIHMNGTKLTINGEVVFQSYMPEELLHRVFDFGREHNICFGTTVDSEDYFLFPERKYHSDHTFTDSIKRNFNPVDDIFRKHIRVTAMSFAGDADKDIPVVSEAFPELLFLPFNSGAGADVIMKEYSKASGMKKLCEYYGIDRKDTYAFGDSLNDVQIIREAGTGIAMGNACQLLKDMADYVTTDIDKDGIWNACAELGLIDPS